MPWTPEDGPAQQSEMPDHSKPGIAAPPLLTEPCANAQCALCAESHGSELTED
jgi:hypothetical protein